MRVSKVIVLVSCLALTGLGAADVTAEPAKAAPTKAGTITVAISDLGCTGVSTDTFEARSWSWGAEQLLSESQQIGKSVLDGLSLTRVADACSPALLRHVLMGLHNKELRLSQYDANGALKATVQMMDVTLTSWKIAGATSGEAGEQVSVSASKFSFTDVASGATFCYDVKAQKGC